MPLINKLSSVGGTTNVASTSVLIVNVGSTTMKAYVHQILAGIFTTAGEIPYAVSSVESAALAPPSSGAILSFSTVTGLPAWSVPSSGAILIASSVGTPKWLAIGTSGQILQTSGGVPTWVDSSLVDGTLLSTVGTSGQILQTTGGVATWIGLTTGGLFYGNSSNEVTVLGVGTSGYLLQSTGGIPAWVPAPSTGQITTAGTSGQVLQTTGGAAAWVNSTTLLGTLPSTIGTSGQILQTTGGVAGWVNTSGALADITAPTTAGAKLVMKSSSHAGWIDDDWSFTAVMNDGVGSTTLTTGIKKVFEIPSAIGIEDMRLALNTTASSGTFAVDIYVDDISSTPASSASKITGGDPPTVSSGTQRSSGITSSWTTAIEARDWVTLDVIDPSSGIKWAAVTLFGKKLSTATIWSPTDIAGLLLWLDADAITGLGDGDPIATWADQSGNGNDALQVTAAKKPLYKTNVANGLAVVRADATDDFLALTSNITGEDLTIIFVVASTKTTPNAVFGGGAFQNRCQLSAIGGSPVFYCAGDYYRYFVDNPAHYDGSFHIHGLLVPDKDVSNSAWYIDGSLLDVRGTVDTTPTSLNIADILGNDPWHFFDGDIAEFIVYNSILSDADRNLVENYLSTKYGVEI